MNLRIQSRDFSLTPAVETAIRRHLQRALGRFEESVVAVDVFIRDVNGPKGGPDKSCLLRVQLPGRTTIPVEAVDEDVYAAIGGSARRAGRAVRRALERSRRHDRRTIMRFRHQEDLAG